MVEAGIAFYKEGKCDGEFVDAVFVRNMRQMILDGSAVVFASFSEKNEFMGALAIKIGQSIFNDCKVASEIFWFVLKRFRGGTAGIKLFRTCDTWCKLNSIKMAVMFRLFAETEGADGDSIDRLFIANGFQPREKCFIKNYSVTT